MVDELANKLAEARKKMFGDLQSSGGKILLLSKGEAEVKSSDPQIEVRKASS